MDFRSIGVPFEFIIFILLRDHLNKMNVLIHRNVLVIPRVWQLVILLLALRTILFQCVNKLLRLAKWRQTWCTRTKVIATSWTDTPYACAKLFHLWWLIKHSSNFRWLLCLAQWLALRSISLYYLPYSLVLLRKWLPSRYFAFMTVFLHDFINLQLVIV